jgi:hypothetical protein
MWLILRMMLVAKSTIELENWTRHLRIMVGFTIRHQHHIK